MLLGKRPRPPMRRTTSMTEFAFDLDVDSPQPSINNLPVPLHHHHQQNDWLANSHVAAAGMLSPRNSGRNRRSSANQNSTAVPVIKTAPFLKACGLCKRRLGPGRDIYIYRGEVAFCSLECRQQLINEEERKEKCSLISIKTETHTGGGSEALR